jgi:type II secretory pathway component PulJ
VVSSKQLLEYVCYNFYNKLYKTQKVSTQEEEELRAMMLNSLPKRFFEAVNVKLACKLTTNNEFVELQNQWPKEKPMASMVWLLSFTSFFGN